MTLVITTNLIIAIVALVALVAVIFFFIRFLRKRTKKNKEQKTAIPDDVLADFLEAERRYKISNGEEDPIKIMWEIQKEKSEKSKKQNAKELLQYQYQRDINPINTIKKEVTEDGIREEEYNEPGRREPAKRSFRFKKSKHKDTAGELYPQPSGRESVSGFAASGNRQQYTGSERISRDSESGNGVGRRIFRKRK